MENFKKKTFIFNCSTNNSGGAIQNAVNFIKVSEEIYKDTHLIYYILSAAVYEQVKNLLNQSRFIVVNISPARSLKARKKIKKFTDRINPDIIYTSAGPAYVDFQQLHIMGCSNPYVLGAPKEALKYLGGFLKIFKRYLHTLYQKFYIKKADFWIVQTENSKKQLCKLVDNKRIFVVSNSISQYFMKASRDTGNYNDVKLESQKSSLVKILIPSAYYKHKALEKVPAIIADVKSKIDIDIQVTFTINDESWPIIQKQAKIAGVEELVMNHGAYRADEAVDLFLEHDVILQPSVLEVFSTSYIEAIALKKPLVVPLLDFAEGICENYAYYYNPNDLKSYTKAIIEAIFMSEFGNKVRRSEEILSKYGSQVDRVKKIIGVLESVS